jgi:hypothetical protein
MRPFLIALVFFGNMVFAGFAMLAIASFRADDLQAASLCFVLAALAFWGAWECEAALDAQAQDNYEGQFTD